MTAVFSGRLGHLADRDHAATTHLENYDAYVAHGGPSGFSGQGWALIDSASGDVLFRDAWRGDVLAEQKRVERSRRA